MSQRATESQVTSPNCQMSLLSLVLKNRYGVITFRHSGKVLLKLPVCLAKGNCFNLRPPGTTVLFARYLEPLQNLLPPLSGTKS